MAAEKASLGQIPDQGPDPEIPWFAGVAGPHAVDQLAELGAGDRDQIAGLVGKALVLAVAVLGRREHGAEEQHESVGILMGRPDRLLHQIFGIAADLADG